MWKGPYHKGRHKYTQLQVALSQSEDADIDPHIINISSRDLNEIEIKLLEKRLKFTPTQRNTTDLIKDTEEFCRKLRLREFFQESDSTDVSLVKNRSKFKPNPNRDKHLEEYIHCLKRAAHANENNVPIKNNICSQERKAIQSLIEDDSIKLNKRIKEEPL